MSKEDQVKSDAKAVEGLLRNLGKHFEADRIARLRHGYANAVSTCRLLHRDNMELRKRLNLEPLALWKETE